jgi:hypothetical protein
MAEDLKPLRSETEPKTEPKPPAPEKHQQYDLQTSQNPLHHEFEPTLLRIHSRWGYTGLSECQ